MTKAKKPIAFNYSEYTKALEEIERLKEENERLKRQLELRKGALGKGATVTDIIWFVKNTMCMRCKFEEECSKRLAASEELRECPMDLI